MERTEQHINNLLDEGNLNNLAQVSNGVHYLRTLVTDYAKQKEITSLNYKTDLKSGIRLDPVHYFTNDGLLKETIYLHGEKPVIKVSEHYEYNTADLTNTDMMLSKKAIHSRNKVWQYYFEDGSLDTSDNDSGRDGGDRLTSKSKEKIYSSIIQGLTIGNKRRHNIQMILSERAGACLIIIGILSTSKQAEDQMRQLSAEYSSNFQEYQKYGTENILQDIQNDQKFTWLNATFPTNLQLDQMQSAGIITLGQKHTMLGGIQLYELQNIQGLTIREYFIEKLKGNIK